jgi:hypothetical protein
MLRLLIAILTGAGLMALLVLLLTGDTMMLWIAVGAAAGIGICVLALLLGRRRRSGEVTPDSLAVYQAREEGRLAGARVLTRTPLGPLDEKAPEFRVELLVQPRDRDPYRTTIRRRIEPGQMLDFAPGTALSVVRLGASTPDVVVVDDPVPPMRNLDPAQLPLWEPDPRAKVPGRRRTAPREQSGVAGRRTLFTLAGILAAGAVAWPSREAVLLRIQGVTSGQPLTSFLRGRGQAPAAIGRFVGSREGHSIATEVVVEDGTVSITAPSAPGAEAYERFEVRAVTISIGRPVEPQPSAASEFDLHSVDWEQLPELFERAMFEAGVEESDLHGRTQSAHVAMGGSGEPEFTLRVITADEEHTVHADRSGTLL